MRKLKSPFELLFDLLANRRTAPEPYKTISTILISILFIMFLYLVYMYYNFSKVPKFENPYLLIQNDVSFRKKSILKNRNGNSKILVRKLTSITETEKCLRQNDCVMFPEDSLISARQSVIQVTFSYNLVEQSLQEPYNIMENINGLAKFVYLRNENIWDLYAIKLDKRKERSFNPN